LSPFSFASFLICTDFSPIYFLCLVFSLALSAIYLYAHANEKKPKKKTLIVQRSAPEKLFSNARSARGGVVRGRVCGFRRFALLFIAIS